MNEAKLRAWWWHRQGLDGSLTEKPPAAVLERSGWARSVGGVGPYLTLFARAGTSREAADSAVAKLQIHELPTARGCTYVLPASDFAIGLRVAQPFDRGDMRTAEKLGVTEKEVDKLCDAVLAAVGTEPLDPDAIRAAVGKAARNLGEEGKKRGMITTLPLALGRLQTRGDIRRVPIGGRLDQQRYKYVRWSPNPLAKDKRSVEEALVELARRFFRWIAPARLKEFQEFAGLGVKAAKETVASLDLVPAESGSDLLLLPDDAETFRALSPSAEPQYALVSSLDAIATTRRDLQLLLDPKDRDTTVLVDSKTGPVGGFYDLPNHAILDRGRLIGLWEYDPDSSSIVWATFGVKKSKPLQQKIDEMQAFVRDQLGDARSFSLDSPKSRKPRIEALRAMA
jgi:hypothetical protein